MTDKEKKQRNIFHNQLTQLIEDLDVDKLCDEAQDDIKAALKTLRSGDVSLKQYTVISMKLAPFMDIDKRGDIELYQKVYDRA